MIARNTAFTFKGKAVDVKQIGSELLVRYVLEGSVQRSGNRLRVNVQLIDAETGNHLWAERFDKPVADLFDMQDEIVARLANTLNAELVAAEARRAERFCILMQWTCTSREGLHIQGADDENMAEARGFFERAWRLIQVVLRQLVGTARVDLPWPPPFMMRIGQRASQRPKRERRRCSLSRRTMPIAHLFLGIVYNLTGRASSAIAKCERALTLDRNLANARRGSLGTASTARPWRRNRSAMSMRRFVSLPDDILAYRWMMFRGLTPS